jgi:hypothetical protein
MRALLPLLLLAGCAVAPPMREPPLSYPPAARERMLRIAQAEWEEWGRIVAAPGLAARRLESDPANFPRVLAYWRSVPDAEGVVERNRALYRPELPGGSTGLWAEPPWSAAFVSYVMRAAGVDRREFPPSAAHARYVDALIADARDFPSIAPFLPWAPEERAPRPGDLICADRSAAPIRHWQDRAADRGAFRPMHCDIVVAHGPGRVEAIGGNVSDAVTLTRFPTDAAGRLMPRPSGTPAWFAVFENRLGLLPPWGPAPSLPPGSPAS